MNFLYFTGWGFYGVLISNPELPKHTHILCHAAEVSNTASTAAHHHNAQLQSGGSHADASPLPLIPPAFSCLR